MLCWDCPLCWAACPFCCLSLLLRPLGSAYPTIVAAIHRSVPAAWVPAVSVVEMVGLSLHLEEGVPATLGVTIWKTVSCYGLLIFTCFNRTSGNTSNIV